MRRTRRSCSQPRISGTSNQFITRALMVTKVSDSWRWSRPFRTSRMLRKVVVPPMIGFWPPVVSRGPAGIKAGIQLIIQNSINCFVSLFVIRPPWCLHLSPQPATFHLNSSLPSSSSTLMSHPPLPLRRALPRRCPPQSQRLSPP